MTRPDLSFNLHTRGTSTGKLVEMKEAESEETERDLGAASSIRADALGEPGQRRFRLLIDAEGGSAVLWLEKEQLFQLGVAIRQLLTELSEESLKESMPLLAEPLPKGSFDFKVERLTLAHDRQRNLFFLLAHQEDVEKTALSCWATGRQVEALAEEAFRVCAAGRPRCPLCGAPLEPDPHICPRSNGHGLG